MFGLPGLQVSTRCLIVKKKKKEKKNTHPAIQEEEHQQQLDFDCRDGFVLVIVQIAAFFGKKSDKLDEELKVS